MEHTDKTLTMEDQLEICKRREAMLMESRDGFRDLYIETEKKMRAAEERAERLALSAIHLAQVTDAMLAWVTLRHGEEIDPETWQYRIPVKDPGKELEGLRVHTRQSESGFEIFVIIRGENEGEP